MGCCIKLLPRWEATEHPMYPGCCAAVPPCCGCDALLCTFSGWSPLRAFNIDLLFKLRPPLMLPRR